MFIYVVSCRKCGFRSDLGHLGTPSIMDQERFLFPVYLPSSGTMLTHLFDSRELGIEPEEFDAWFAANLHQAIAKQHGPEAIVLRLGADEEALREISCPKCHLKQLSVKSNLG